MWLPWNVPAMATPCSCALATTASVAKSADTWPKVRRASTRVMAAVSRTTSGFAAGAICPCLILRT
jgi:hypothetical protein